MTSTEELEMAINNCKLLVFDAPEHSERRKNLVGKLVQLRLKLQEAEVCSSDRYYIYVAHFLLTHLCVDHPR